MITILLHQSQLNFHITLLYPQACCSFPFHFSINLCTFMNIKAPSSHPVPSLHCKMVVIAGRMVNKQKAGADILLLPFCSCSLSYMILAFLHIFFLFSCLFVYFPNQLECIWNTRGFCLHIPDLFRIRSTCLEPRIY